MPQETNLNVSPYYDDFDSDKNFYRVLFKPSYPVQARELNNIQSILQNQIENFGDHIFKEGSVVIPGQTTYIKNFNCIEINSFFGGIPVSSYTDKLIGLVVKGRSSGVTAKIIKILNANESERNNITIYIDYINSSTDGSKSQFIDNEIIETTKSVEISSNVFISPGEGIFSTINLNCNSIGSGFGITEGIYYIRGHFVKVYDDIVVLSQYSNTPSCRVGLLVEESIVNYYEDESLTDNARGFNNFSAPGADRLKISTQLAKKDIDDFEDKNFILLTTIKDGVIRDKKSKTEYSFIMDEFARRTNDESGDYYVKSFNVSLKESLNSGFGNGGIHSKNEKTQSGSTPKPELALYKISAGKAYVKGYEVETFSPVFLDVLKPRTTKKIDYQAINFDFGPQFNVNRVYGSPEFGFNTSSILSLRDSRTGSDQSVASGNEIGVARAYDFYLENGSYSPNNLNTNLWNLSVFDIQMYSVITLNSPVTLNTPVYVTGQQTGATGHLKSNVSSSSTITVYQVNGKFSDKEVILFEGDVSDSESKRVISDVKNYGISDVKSIYSSSGSKKFNCDTVQKIKVKIGSATISPKVGTASTATVTENISNKVKSGDIVSFSSPGISTITYSKVTSVNTTSKEIELIEIQSISGVNYGILPPSQITVSDFNILETKLSETEYTGNPSDNNGLFSALPKANISEIDLTESQITIRKEFSVDITSNSTGVISAGVDEIFLPFDEERYTLIRSNGQLENLTDDKFTFIDGSTKLRIDNLGSNDTGSRLITTIRKSNLTSKTKNKVIVESLIINKSNNPSSGIGSTTLEDGLIYGDYPYGTRTQDSQICLNKPDINLIYGIFESKNVNDPEPPVTSLSSMTGATSTTNDLIIGEYFQGRFSKARGIFIEKKSDTSIGFIYLNENRFSLGEIIDFERSNVSANIGSVTEISVNVTSKYSLYNGQKPSYYDYSKLIRNPSTSPSSKKLKVYYMRGYYDGSDSGDITTKESYNSFDYANEIPTIKSIRVTDIIDLRPRVKDYSVSVGSRSPFEFDGRDFSGSNHSSKHIISNSDPLTLGYSYYLPRYDRIYLNRDGTFSVKNGVASDDPKLPDVLSGSMNIANIYLPPYLYSTKDAIIDFVSYKRYQMKDIAKIESRLNRLERTTSLSLLETKTETLFVDDGTGLNRFKSGFFVDNFTSLLTQFPIGIKNSIDVKRGLLRPSHYTTDIKLQIASNDVLNNPLSVSDSDYRYESIIGSNIKRSGDIITLDYTEVSWLRQPFATRTENVTPYFVTLYEGSIELNPTVDVWIDTTIIEPNNVVMEGSFTGVAESLQAEITDNNDGSRTGVSPVIWDSWETTGIDVNVRTEVNSSSSTSNFTNTGSRQGNDAEFAQFVGEVPSGGVPNTFTVGTETSGTTTTTVTTTNEFLNVGLDQSRSGTQYTVNEEINTESLGERIVSRELINYMRSRNIEFIARRMKPFTKVYPFFDNVNVSDYCFNKLIEIEMISGTFEVGESVTAYINNYSISGTFDISGRFRVATLNHKYGPYNNPTDVYDRNPFDRDNVLSTEYNQTSTILNIDTFSLSEEVNSDFFGYVGVDMVIYGESSGAQAIVTNVDLVTDRVGTLIGSYRVPNNRIEESPRFETGRSRFRLTSSSTNSQVPGVVTTYAEETFYSQGDSDISQATTLSLRNARVEVDTSFVETKSLSDEAIIDSTTTVSSSTNSNTRLTGEYRDPLAQSFIVDDETGIFVTKVDIYFRTKDESLPVTVQIREIELGIPSQKILAFSEVELTPDKVNLSEDASVATSFIFPSPVYLEGQREYAIIIISNSNEYNLWISRLGEPDIATLENEQNQILVTTQRLLGSLFKSQNASTWTPSQYEDLTFNLFRADFKSSGFTQFFNQNLPDTFGLMRENPLLIESQKVKVSLSSTVTSSIDFGTRIIQSPVGFATAQGVLVGYGGSATGTLQVINAGIGFTPSSGTYTYTNVDLKNINSDGLNAKATIIIENGSASSATITNGGSGYSIGDLLEPVSIGNNNLGVGMILSVSEIEGYNQLIIDKVQGEFKESGTDKIQYVNNSNQVVDLNGTSIYINSPVKKLTDGVHIKVFHRNHGMYSESNFVTIKNVETDINSSKLTSDYLSSSTDALPVSDTSDFETFENLGVSVLNPGYVIINKEIIEYTGVTATTLTGITRGVDSTTPVKHFNEDLVRKYELGGISLRRINTDHDLSNVDTNIKDKIGVNHYYVKIDTGTRTDLKFNETKEVGGKSCIASYNIPFNAVNPNIKAISPTNTSIKYEINTVTGTTIGGNEVSFVDAGAQNIENISINYFDTPRLIASPINQVEWLDDVSFNKSISLNTYFTTLDSRVSPAIDLSQTDVVLISNVISDNTIDYVNDYRVNTLYEDPHLFQYVTNLINLEVPASGLKVIFDAYINIDSNVRVLYSIGDSQVFTLFPGYSNINADGSIIDFSQNNGTTDKFISKTDHNTFNPLPVEYIEHEYTIDNLTSFKSYRIKIVGTSSNSSFVPIIKNLRAIALGSI
jgi:hypothetical protein